MEGELLWFFYDDVFSGWIPANHVMIFWPFKKTVVKDIQIERERGREG